MALTCIDLSRAFDCVDIGTLLNKLRKIGLSKSFFDLLAAYFTNRKQYVRIDNNFSSLRPVFRGTPQGGVLSGFFFNFYVQSLSFLTLSSQLVLYADDMSLITSATDTATLKQLMETDLDLIRKWLNLHLLTPNAKKTKYICFHNRKSFENFTVIPLNICFNNVVLERVDSIRVLGLELDERLNFNNHVTNLHTSVAPFIFAFRRARPFISLSTAKMLYFAYIHSKFSYMSSVWPSAPKYLVDSIEILQKKGLRIVFNKDWSCRSYELFSQDILPISVYAELHCLFLFFKMKGNAMKNNHQLITFNQVHSLNTRNAKNYVCNR